ncbi:hypothetical protein VPHD479_0220 [Vibrio phage D479]
MSDKITEKDMQYAICVNSPWIMKRYDAVVPNCYTRWENEADLFCMRKSGLCDEMEIKVTRSDFKNDAKKTVRLLNENYTSYRDKWVETPKTEALTTGHMSNYFWYCIPEGLMEFDEIPAWAGIIVVIRRTDGSLCAYEKRAPKRLHGGKMSEEEKFKQVRKLGFRYWDLRKKNGK